MGIACRADDAAVHNANNCATIRLRGDGQSDETPLIALFVAIARGEGLYDIGLTQIKMYCNTHKTNVLFNDITPRQK